QFVTIRSERVESIAPAFVADFRMRWQIPLDGDGSFLDLQGEFENVNASSVPRYLPVGILKKPLIAWLDNAFLSGRASRGGVVFRGPVAAFPFHGGEGVFETLFFTKDVVLAYHPAWPVIHSDNAEVRFYQAGMELSARHATVSGIPVEDVRGHCDNFETADYLKVTGRAKATLGQGINFLKQTPLGALYEPLLEFVSLHGDSRVDLALNIPIGPKTEDLDVKGAIVLKKARVAAFGTQLERVTGRLEFSPERIHGNAIRGELLGYPVVVDLADNARGLAVQIKGSIATKSLAERFPSAPWGYFDGATDYSIDLQIPKLTEKLYADIDIYSDLRGIRILLPEPLQKAAEIPRRFNAKTHLVPGRGFPLEVMYGKIARARLNWITASDGFHWEQGDIKLGRTAPTEIPAEGLSFYADLEKLDLGPWKSFLASMDPDGEMHSGLLNLVDVQIDHLRLDDFEIGPFTLRMQRNHGVWGGFTESQLARGRFGAMDQARQNSGLDMAFEYLRIPQQTSSKKKTSQGAFRWDPRSIVDLNVKADHFYWKAVDYGKLELVTSRKVDGMNIEQLNIRQKGLDLSLSGSWTASDSIDRTSISGRLAIDNLGDFLTRIGKSNVIRDSDVKSTVSLNWNDPLYDLRSETLFGSAQVEFGQGRLLTVEPGLGRVFGLFNLDGLKNLLLFDFGKLFGQGMAFEQVTSAFLLREGHATITRLSIDAVPAELSVAGEIDLVGERLHGNVTVVPKGVVAAGASMLLTQELPGSAVDGLINREYQVSGKWDNPEIVRLPGSGKRL
ncbi:MAG: YhdP family phospholipid transporter, partial [Gammaproteobacteria bacterium]